jgi:hypothetical protein
VSSNFDPAVRGLHFRVPAIRGVVCHLSRHVLSESYVCRLEADSLEEEIGTAHVISKSLVVDETALNSFSKGDVVDDNLLSTLLVLSGEEG